MPETPHLLLWTGIFGLDGPEVHQDFTPGGVVLFGRNLDPDPSAGPARCAALVRQLQDRWGAAAPLAVALDQEGGSVSRLRPWTGPTPSLRDLWRQGGPGACRRWGALWGRGLALLGINVDFAPVADLWAPGAALGDRCASPLPLEAAAAAGAFLHGLEEAGVRGCLKHFPGLGGTALDSHLGLPERADPRAASASALPFRMLAHADRLVMVAHLLLPESRGLPASLCRSMVADNPWGLCARWLPDDLEMGGCRDWDWPERVRLSLEAGHQALLVCQTEPGIAACARAAEQVPEALWRPALARFQAMRRHLPAAPGFSPEAWSRWLQELQEAVAARLPVEISNRLVP
ncbi:MAG: glycoside hydrolase family 3 N-terminal domain-containing protein [Holophaga sp.]|nr:glycoside hydrolase family 3 N-terminal domain-containing protein [Holophaga sp.]